MTPEVSVVVPLHNEEENIRLLHEELTTAMAGLGIPYELILVDDGSEDGTFARLGEVYARDACQGDPVHAKLRPDGGVCRWFHSCPWHIHCDRRR